MGTYRKYDGKESLKLDEIAAIMTIMPNDEINLDLVGIIWKQQLQLLNITY